MNLIVVAFWFVISGALAQAQTACDTNCTAPAGGEVLALAGPADATLTYLLSINGTSALFANATIYFNSQPVGSLSFVNGDAVFDFVNGFTAGSYSFTVEARDTANALVSAWGNTLTVTEPPPPSTQLPTCTTSGIVYQSGTLNTFRVRVRERSSWLSARAAEGWNYVSEKVANKAWVNITLQCQGI